MISGPAPAPLARAETYYRYQIMLRTGRMTQLGVLLTALGEEISLPEGVTMTIDVDPLNLF
jgi:primosomal protein N'